MLFQRQQVTRGARWIETVVITVSAPILGSLVAPVDPYLLRSPFPWLILAPLFVALQHGVWAGLGSTLLLCAGAVWQSMSNGPLSPSFASWGIGCLVVSIVAGQFRDWLRGKSEFHEQRAEDLQDRLERSERTRHLIQLSHAQLVERVAASRSSLVAVIEGAERQMSEASSMHELGQVLLDVAASQGNLHAASLYIVAPRDHSTLLGHPLATFGGSGESAAEHPLVSRAFKTGKLAAIVDGEPASTDRSVLAAVPLITSQRHILGVVAVHQMPFMSFQADHLNQLFVLAGHLADMLFDRSSSVDSGLRRLPKPEPEIELEPEPVSDSSAPASFFAEPVEVPTQMEHDAAITIDVDDRTPAPSTPKAAVSVPRIELPPARAQKKAAAPAPHVIGRVETKSVLVEKTPAAAPLTPAASAAAPVTSPAQNPITRTIGQLVPESARKTFPPPKAAAAPRESAPASAPAPKGNTLLSVRVPPAPAVPKFHTHEKRQDVTETRLVHREKPRAYEIRSRKATREFPAVKLTPPAADPQPEAAADRPKAQATIRTQVAEAAARRTSSN